MAADTAPAPAFTASLNTYTSIAGEERMLVPILKVYWTEACTAGAENSCRRVESRRRSLFGRALGE